MRFARRAWLRIRSVLGRGGVERDMQLEMREHIVRATDRLIARGMSRDEARLAAKREFGNLTVIQEDARDARGMRWLEALVGDLRFAFRYFGRNKLTVALIVSVFALGIGANTALVTVIQSQFQRGAPVVPDDDALVLIRANERATRTASWDHRGFTNEELRALAAQTGTFTHVAGWLAHDVVLDAGDSIGARGVRAHFITSNYFLALGVGITAGVGFGAADDANADLSAVMSFEWAEHLFGVATNAVGQRVIVNDVPVHVIGLTPPAFQGALRQMDRPALFIPVSARADIARRSPRWVIDDPVMEGFARLAPDVSYDRAATIAQLVLARSLPDSATRVGMARMAQVFSLHALLPESHELILIFTMLGVIGVLLLLVTCTNVSSLMVAAAVARRHEIAVRLSLGASRARILRQLLTEATLLALAGGMLGLTVWWWLLEALGGPGGTIDGNRVRPDVFTLAWTILVATGTGTLFGLSPALHAMRTGAANALRDSGIGSSRRSRLQSGFVVAQIVFSLPLLVMLGTSLSLGIADFRRLRADVAEHVIRVTFRPLRGTGAPEHRREAVEALIPRLAGHPEIRGVVPEAEWRMSRRFMYSIPKSIGREDTAHVTLLVEGAAPGWFGLLDVPIILGRDLAFADTAARDWPVVIGSHLARGLWRDANPIGRTFASPGQRDTVMMTVVGVYDATQTTTRNNDSLKVFTAQGKEWRRDALLVRTRGSAEAFLPQLRLVVRDLAPGLPVSSMLTLGQLNESDRRETVIIGTLVGAGGMLALLLASLGLYGVIALAIRQRTREIGIRIALGAKPARVARMFLASGVRLGVIGLAVGLPVSILALKIFLSQSEFLVPKVDVWLVAGVTAVVLLLVATAATWIPARRAALVDPATTLRVE